MLHDTARARTDFRVMRWEAGAATWAAHRLGKRPVNGNLVITPAEFASLGIRPYEDTTHYDCNLIVQAGWVALLGGIAGSTIVNKFSSTFGRIGVGTINTLAAYSDTHLGGDTGGASTTSYYQLCGSAPTVVTASTPPTLTFTATFGSSNANFAWQEFGIDNYSASGVTAQGLSNLVFFNHGISNQGTKVSGQVWTAVAQVSFGYPSGSGTVS